MIFKTSGPDLILVLDQDDEGHSVEISAWHQVMVNASPVFAAMLQPNAFQEGSQLQEHGRARIPLPETDAAAMQILCNIFHLRTNDIPITNITFDSLSEMATLIDKFDCASCVQPWPKIWLQQPQIQKEIQSVKTMELKSIIKGIHIFYHMGDGNSFESFTSTFLEEVSKDALEDPVVHAEFEKLSGLLQDRLLERRQTCIGKFRKLIYDLLVDLEQDNTCRQSVGEQERFDCTSILLGNARIAVRQVLGAEWKSEDSWAGSVTHLRGQMKMVANKLEGSNRVHQAYRSNYRSGSYGCGRSYVLLQQVEEIYQSTIKGFELK